MTIKTFERFIVSIGVSLLLTGCASSPPTHFYTLEPSHSKQEARPLSTQNKMTIGIGPIEIPKLLDRTQIVTRHENHRVQLAEFHQWGEPLKENVARVLARNIAALRTNDVIRSYPWSAFGKVDYRVVLNFSQFDATPGQSVMLEVDWTIMDENNHRILTNGHSIIEQPLHNDSYPHGIEVMSKTLGELGLELSRALEMK